MYDTCLTFNTDGDQIRSTDCNGYLARDRLTASYRINQKHSIYSNVRLEILFDKRLWKDSMTPWKLLNISLVTLLAWSVVFCQGSGQSDMSILIFVVNLTQIKNEHLSVIGQVMENAAKNSHPFVFFTRYMDLWFDKTVLEHEYRTMQSIVIIYIKDAESWHNKHICDFIILKRKSNLIHETMYSKHTYKIKFIRPRALTF